MMGEWGIHGLMGGELTFDLNGWGSYDKLGYCFWGGGGVGGRGGGGGMPWSTHHHWWSEVGHSKRAVPSHGRRRKGVVGRVMWRGVRVGRGVGLCRW